MKPIERTSALAVLSLSLAVGPTVASMQWLPGDDLVGVATGHQQDPEIAQGGEFVLALWADERSAPTNEDWFEYETASDIYGMRFDADGQPLDVVPFVVTQAKAAQTQPKAAWNGTHWLVVFETLSDTEFFYESALAAVRVTPAGEVVDDQPIEIFGVEPVGGESWTLASDDDGWVIGFRKGNTYQMHALRIAADGTVEQPPRLLVSGGGTFRSDLQLAHAGGVYLLTWSESFETLAIRFDTELVVLDVAPYVQHESEIEDLASNGSEFYAIWTEFATGVFGSRIDTAGVKLDGAGADIAGNNAPDFQAAKNVTWDGTQWKVAWTRSEVLRLARVDAAGQVLDFGGFSVPGPQIGPMAATGSGGLYLVWSDYVENEDDVFGAHVPATGPADANIALSLAAPQQARSDVALGSDGYMVVYRSDGDYETRIKVMPLDAAGVPLLAAALELDSGHRFSGPGTPAVAWNGALYLVAWGAVDGIVAQRILQDGTLVDPVPFVVMPGFGAVDVSALDGNFLVIGRQFGFTFETILPVISRVRGDGVVLDPDGVVVGANYVRSVAVTTLGDQWLAIWHRTFSHDDPLGENMAAFVDPSGTASGDFQVFGLYSNTGGNSIFTMTAAAGPDTAIVVQSAELSSGVETDLAAVIVHADGTVDPFINITPWSGNQYRPKAAWDGDQFVVVYNDQKNRFATEWGLTALDARSDLFGMRIGADGTIRDPQGFAFSLSQTAEAFPAIASGDGVSLIAGSILRNEEPFAAYRVGYDRLGLGANAWPVAVASADVQEGDVPLTVQFDSLGSFDPDGAMTSFLWNFGDGFTSPIASPLHTYEAPGNYVPTLTVTDDAGGQTTDTVRINADAPNIPPVAIATADVTRGPAPLAVVFNGDGSYDVDGSLGNFFWEFGDGGTSWGQTAYHTFTDPGDYIVTLTVWDDDGATGTDSLTIEVTTPCLAACLRVEGIRLRPAERNGILGVRGGLRVVDENDAAIGDAAVDVQWTLPDGSLVDQTDTTTPNGIARFGTPGGAGTYTFTVIGIDKPGFTFDPDNSVLSESIDR